MSSGVKVNKECTSAFEEMKMKRNCQYLTFKLSDNLKEIVVDESGDKGATYEQLGEYLMGLRDDKGKACCRYAVYDLDFELEGSEKNKLVFVSWAPEGANLKTKMVYTSSKDYLKKALQLTIDVQATDADELSRDNAVEKARRGMKA